MNKIYKLKYDRRRQQLVAVSELTTGAGKEATGQVCGLSDISSFRKLLGTLTPLAFLTGLIVSLLPGMALANPSLPVGGQIVAGQGSISTSGNQMTVNQNTQGMVTNWNSFDIGKNHTVQFVQPGSSAVALNRVTGGHESQILGTLKANGQVMLINPAGVMFGKGAKVNTAGLVASTKNISNEDFMAGRYTFSGGSQPGAEIVNQGSLTTTKGGYIVLAADRVRNQGEIRTPGGRVVLAAADRVTLQLDNTGLTAVSVNGSVVNALAENRGLISATNGQVYLTARGKDMLLNTVVNNSGTVEAKGLSERGGEIVLDGGDSGVVSQSGMLLADSDSGRGGKITLEGQNIHLAGGSLISATGETGGGEVYVGGGWQGKDSSIRHASKVVMDKTAVIDVSAKARGQGGTAVLWSDDYTNFRGTILARGGLQGGDGGRVETSSHHNLQAFGDVDASAVKGNAGEWLLDPFDITVVSGSTDTDVNEGSGNDGIFTPDSGTSQVSNGTINNRLNSGTNVTIKTAKENSGSTQWGNITVNADISHTATNNVSLTLEADGNINITNHNITSTTGKLDVNLLGAGSHDGTITLNNATVSSNGGNITLGQLNAGSDGTTSGLAVSITNSTLNATSAGNISITANNGTTLDNGTLSGNEVSVSASSGTGDALVINNGSKLTAAGNIGLNATVANGNALVVSGGNITAGKDISLTGTAKAGTSTGLNLVNATLNATTANLSGISTNAGTGFTLNNVTLAGGIEKGKNVSFSSAGSGKAVTNVIGSGVLNATTTEALMKVGIENNTQISASGITLGGSGDDWTQNYTSTKGGGWIFDGATVSKTGNISLQGVGFVNSSVTAGQDLTINNGDTSLTVQNTTLNATAGNISLTGNAGITLSGNSTVTAGKDITLNVSAGGVNITGKSDNERMNISSTAGNITFTANNPGAGDVTGINLQFVNVSVGGNGRIELNSTVHNGSLRAKGIALDSVNLTTGGGNVSVTAVSNGTAVYGKEVVITSGDSINVTTSGKSSGYSYASSNFVNSSFTAKNNISFTATDKEDAGKPMQAALGFYGNTAFNATDTVLKGHHTNPGGVGNFGSIGVALGANAGSGTGNIVVNGNLSVDGSVMDSGAGVTVGANMTVSGTTDIKGHSATGKGVSFTTSMDYAPTPVNLTINISGGGSISGTSDTGIGLLNGNKNNVINITTGTGNALTLTGNSTSSTGVQLDGTVNAAQGDLTVNGSSGNGTGVDASGASLNNATIHGNSTSGAGVNVSESTLNNVTVNGSTANGTGVDITGNLTSTGSTTVNGNATGMGSGVDLAGNVTGGTVNGSSTDGTGVNVSGNSTLTDVTVNGNTTSGTGVDISGNLTNQGNTTITGNSGSGAGVGLNGTVTGGSLVGNSVSGPGLYVTGNSTLNGVDVTDSSQSGPGTQKDSAELRRQVYERQQQLSRSDTVRDAYRASGYRVEEKPVSVEICTDGECRTLETGYADAPKAR